MSRLRTALGLALGLALTTAGAVRAQEVEAGRVAVESGTGAVLRALDRITQRLTDIEIAVGETVRYARLQITLRDCRYPVDNPASDAFAYLVIRDSRDNAPRFAAWMIASSPALSALDHPRYDVWVLRCTRLDSATPSDG